MKVSETVMRLAEEPNVWRPLLHGRERIVEDAHVLLLGPVDHPAFTVVQRLRLADARVEPAVESVRELLRARGRTSATWEIGPSSTPAGLDRRLRALGMVDDAEPLAVGMVLAQEPPHVPGEVEVRRVETLDDYLLCEEITGAGFGMPPSAREERRTSAADRYEAERRVSDAFVAYSDGEPIASGLITFVDGVGLLDGAATLEHARGRGAYRALVGARWHAARERGCEALVTQAGRMSRPILARLGFREVCEVRILLDRFG
jgi:GNAT superfamily N-acetyltransferase